MTTGSDLDAVMVQIGRNLREERKRQDLTQADLEEVTGVHQVSISALERGSRENVTIRTLFKLARGLEMSPADLIRRGDDG